MNVPAVNVRMEAAARLSGPARYAAFGRLDIDIMRIQVPWAALYVPHGSRARLEAGRLLRLPTAFATMDLANVCLK
jgi:hypothetical protein